MASTFASSVSKSMVTMPPTEEAIWSIRPQGLPKKMFSTFWAMTARVFASMTKPLYRPSRIAQMSTSNAAEEDRPLPRSTLLEIVARKPPTL